MNNRIPPIIAFATAIIIFFAYVNPAWTDAITATKAAIASDDRALSAASEYVLQQNELASARNDIDPADLARLTIFLPDSVDNVGLILDLNALAARSGLSLSNIDVVKNEAKSSNSAALPAGGTSLVGSIDLSLSAVGTYDAFRAFLTGIEKSARLLDVRDLSVRGSDSGAYSYKMTLRLYWLR